MSEYMIDGTLLSNIAEEVRKVDGSASLLTPAQMVTRLNVIKSSVDAALSAIAGKNVTVPSGSDVHDLASLIAAISMLPEHITILKTGTVIPTEQTQAFTITHNLGVVPSIFILTSKTNPSKAGSGTVYFWDALYIATGSRSSVIYKGACDNSSIDVTTHKEFYTGNADIATSTDITFSCGFNEDVYHGGYARAGHEYIWIAGVYK